MKKTLTKPKFLFTLIVSATLFSSCQDIDHIFSNFPQKVAGSWEFDRVLLREPWAIDGHDVTTEYRNMVFNFYNDGYMSLEYVDENGNLKIDDGEWKTEKSSVCYHGSDGGSCDEDRSLHITLFQPENGYFHYSVWDITYLGSRKLKAREDHTDGVYKYKLLQRY